MLGEKEKRKGKKEFKYISLVDKSYLFLQKLWSQNSYKRN